MTLLQLKYKGSRTYLHGSDIFNTLEDVLSNIQTGYVSKLVFKNFARNQIQLWMHEPTEALKVLGTAIWKNDTGEERRLWLTETEIAVEESYPFDEEAILVDSEIESRSIQLSVSNNYTTIENVIALTKRLNYTLSPDVNGKWLFGQIDLLRKLPTSWDTLRIDRTVCVANSFSRNRIVVDDEYCGEIRFIGGEP